MTRIKEALGTVIGVAMVIAFTAFIVALVLSLTSEQQPAIKNFGTELRCLLGIPKADSPCVTEKIDALNEQRRVLEEERDRLNDVMAGQSFVFTQGKHLKDRVSLVVGTLYMDAAAQTGLIRSFCWIIVDNGGLDPQVGLGVMHGDGRIEELQASPSDLSMLGMSARDVDAARDACPFPRVS